MKCLIGTYYRNEGNSPEQELAEERFFEQFAALEDGLVLVQIQLRSLAENARLFESLVRQMRAINLPCDSITELRL